MILMGVWEIGRVGKSKTTSILYLDIGLSILQEEGCEDGNLNCRMKYKLVAIMTELKIKIIS